MADSPFDKEPIDIEPTAEEPFSQSVHPDSQVSSTQPLYSQGVVQPPAPQIGQFYSNQQGFIASGPTNDAFAITSLVCGLVGCSLVTAVVAIVFGFLAKSRIKKSNGAIKGNGMATWGIVLGIVWITLIVAYYIVVIALVLNDPTTFQ